MEMSKERLVAFTDAVLAIIMTILILELEKPTEMTWAAIWALKMNFFAYALSFFWLGTMWVNMHRTWDRLGKINNKLVWISLVLLFFSSFFPYTTHLVASHFNNSVAQAIYGIIILAISLANTWMYAEMAKFNDSSETSQIARRHNQLMVWDLLLKVIGLILTLTIFPPAMTWAIVLTGFLIILPRSI